MFELNDFKDTIACITPGGECLTYGELQALSDNIRRETESHQLVFCMCGNTIGALAGYVAFVNNKNRYC